MSRRERKSHVLLGRVIPGSYGRHHGTDNHLDTPSIRTGTTLVCKLSLLSAEVQYILRAYGRLSIIKENVNRTSSQETQTTEALFNPDILRVHIAASNSELFGACSLHSMISRIPQSEERIFFPDHCLRHLRDDHVIQGPD